MNGWLMCIDHVLFAMLHCEGALCFTWKGKGLMCCSLSKRQGLLGFCTAALQAIFPPLY